MRDSFGDPSRLHQLLHLGLHIGQVFTEVVLLLVQIFDRFLLPLQFGGNVLYPFVHVLKNFM